MKQREQMPSLTGATEWLNGEITKEELLGKPTLVYFWSSSCIQCQNLMPKIKILSDNSIHLHVLMVHMPRSNMNIHLNIIKEKAKGITVPIAIDSNYAISDAFSNPFTPAFYLFDKEGRLDFFQTGGGMFEILLKRIARLLNK